MPFLFCCKRMNDMSNAVRDLEPRLVWNFFEDLNAVPRPSKKEERVVAFMEQFARDRQLDYTRDHVSNIIMRKPATPGLEDRVTVVLQGHVDMVHQKNADTDFDFLTEGIRSFIDGDWVKAEGTTLGADNGMGVAAIMALLDSSDIPHPPLEALFTIDEETGMTGAMELQPNQLTGQIMLNLDTEEDNELTIGCAGGVDTTATASYAQEAPPAGASGYRITVKGLQGGHSGMDIHKGFGNANKLLNRILFDAAGVRVARIDGGGLRNAIPREALAEVAVTDTKVFEAHMDAQRSILQAEYKTVEPGLVIECVAIPTPEQVMAADFQHKLVRAIQAAPNGVYRMSPDMENLVETSNNVARVIAASGHFECHALQRSSNESQKQDIARAVRSAFELMGCTVEHSGDYPGWQPLPGSHIVQLMSDLYRERFSEEPDVNACHAGLECGILGRNYPDMQMISFGPTIRGAHSPDERVEIASVQKFWGFLKATLERIPTRKEFQIA